MVIGFLPNKESARETRVNPLQRYFCLHRGGSEPAGTETSVHYPSGNLYEGDVLPISCNAIGGANCGQNLAG